MSGPAIVHFNTDPANSRKKQLFDQVAGSASDSDLNTKAMKRHSGLFPIITSSENLELADRRARRGKSQQPAVQEHMLNAEANLAALQQQLRSNEFRTAEYKTFIVREPKERLVYRLPYFPDRIVHHAIMNVIEPIFVGVFTRDTYSCIRGRGIHAAANAVRSSLQDRPGTAYCLKFDIRKFYPSVNHAILKDLLRRKFKDVQLLALLDEIIDSAVGLPIGNYLSQYLANFYLAYFDHWVKEILGAKHYFRYADDIVLLSGSKPQLHEWLGACRVYLRDQLALEIKGNYQVFPVAARGIDFVGYKFYHTHTLLRKLIKQNFARMLARRRNHASITAYYGWAIHANTKNLLKKLFQNDNDNQKILGLRDQSRSRALHRRKNQNPKDPQQGNNCSGLPDPPFKQERRRMSVPADRSGRNKAPAVLRIGLPDPDDPAGAQGELSFPDDNCSNR